jgi:hypothetical protein
MAKDPAFLFYPADASNDTQFMNRLERGAYFDLVKGQRLYGGYTMVQLRKILGSDFESVWPSLELVLEFDGERYFVGWLKSSISKREDYSKKQSERIKKRWNKDGNTVVLPKKENEIENEIENIIEVKNINTEPKFQKPTESEISEFLLLKYPDCNKVGLKNFTTKFWSHYENNGWKVGKNKMKNWRLAINSWSETLQKDLFPNLILPSQPQKISKVDQRIESVKQGLALIDEMYSGKEKTNPLDFD